MKNDNTLGAGTCPKCGMTTSITNPNHYCVTDELEIMKINLTELFVKENKELKHEVVRLKTIIKNTHLVLDGLIPNTFLAKETEKVEEKSKIGIKCDKCGLAFETIVEHGRHSCRPKEKTNGDFSGWEMTQETDEEIFNDLIERSGKVFNLFDNTLPKCLEEAVEFGEAANKLRKEYTAQNISKLFSEMTGIEIQLAKLRVIFPGYTNRMERKEQLEKFREAIEEAEHDQSCHR